MKKLLCVLLLLAILVSATGCASLLDREYSTVQPHKSTYYERENLLRAETYQDLVNDLMLLIGEGSTEGIIRIYAAEAPFDVPAAMERACTEVRTQTPLGAYAIEYLTYVVEDGSRNYDQVSLTIRYRRDQVKVKGITYITGISALRDLLKVSAENHASELVVQVGYFEPEQKQQVKELVKSVQAELNGPVRDPWGVNFYPENGSEVIIEILL